MTKLQISPLLPGLRMSTLAKNASQVVVYENQVSDFVALLWMQTPLAHWTTRIKPTGNNCKEHTTVDNFGTILMTRPIPISVIQTILCVNKQFQVMFHSG